MVIPDFPVTATAGQGQAQESLSSQARERSYVVRAILHALRRPCEPEQFLLPWQGKQLLEFFLPNVDLRPVLNEAFVYSLSGRPCVLSRQRPKPKTTLLRTQTHGLAVNLVRHAEACTEDVDAISSLV
jgi:hypothetical protein